MRRTLTILIISALLGLGAVFPAASADEEPGREFTATAEMTTSQGTRRMPVTIIVSRFTSVEEARQLSTVLENGGQDGLIGAIRERADGKLRLGVLDRPLSVVVAEPIRRGYRYTIVTARPLQVDEINESRESLDYPFGVAVFEVGDFGRGEGELYPSSALHVGSDGEVSVDQYEGEPGRLLEIKKVR